MTNTCRLFQVAPSRDVILCSKHLLCLLVWWFLLLQPCKPNKSSQSKEARQKIDLILSILLLSFYLCAEFLHRDQNLWPLGVQIFYGISWTQSQRKYRSFLIWILKMTLNFINCIRLTVTRIQNIPAIIRNLMYLKLWLLIFLSLFELSWCRLSLFKLSNFAFTSLKLLISGLDYDFWIFFLNFCI